MGNDLKRLNKDEYQNILLRVSEAMIGMKNEAGMQEKYPVGLIDIDLWEWPQGVGLYGLMRYYQASGNRKVFDFLCSWMDRHLAAQNWEHNVNTTIPCLTMLMLGQETGNRLYLDYCEKWAEWVMKDLIRTGGGAFQHMITGDPNDGQILIDTLYMVVLFLVHMGKALGKREYEEEALRQILTHIQYLFDAKTHLFFHGYSFKNMNHYGAVHWGRGNAWLTAVLAELLSELDCSAGVREYLRCTLLAQCRALEKLQDKNGMWHTVLDDPDSYCETSATACMAYGILKGIHTGILPESLSPVAYRAVNAVLEQIDEAGVVHGVSYGTPVGDDIAFYRSIPVCPMTYGQAMTILMLTEA